MWLLHLFNLICTVDFEWKWNRTNRIRLYIERIFRWFHYHQKSIYKYFASLRDATPLAHSPVIMKVCPLNGLGASGYVFSDLNTEGSIIVEEVVKNKISKFGPPQMSELIVSTGRWIHCLTVPVLKEMFFNFEFQV